MVLVKKRMAQSNLVWTTYHRLNEVTRKDSYPLPRSDDTIEALTGSEWFSTLDLKGSYWQVDIDDKDMEKTAFSIGSGLW